MEIFKRLVLIYNQACVFVLIYNKRFIQFERNPKANALMINNQKAIYLFMKMIK